MADLNEKDLRVFVDAVTHYFKQLSREAPRIRGAYLDTGGTVITSYSIHYTKLNE